MDESGTSTSQLEKDIQDLKHQLVTAIQSIAETLHTHFVEYLNLIHAKGAVVFDDKEAVQNWGLKVMVSFSQGRPISTLQSTTFSGGERAIATMLVLMALQVGCSLHLLSSSKFYHRLNFMEPARSFPHCHTTLFLDLTPLPFTFSERVLGPLPSDR